MPRRARQARVGDTGRSQSVSGAHDDRTVRPYRFHALARLVVPGSAIFLAAGSAGIGSTSTGVTPCADVSASTRRRTTMDRRTFLQAAAGRRRREPAAAPQLARQLKGKVKITDVKCMIVRGTWDWNLIKIETDAGCHGIGEAYWGWGVKDLVLNKLRPIVVGEDPAQRRQALYEDADGERRRGRHRRRHRDRRQRHRDRAVGPGRPPPRDARLQSARRPLPRSRPLLSHDAGGRAAGGSTGLARTGAGRPRPRSSAGPRSSSRATAFRRKPIPTTRSPGTIATRAGSR